MRFKATFWLVVLAACAPQLARAQASVNENLETAFIYVDAAKGSDSNPGTQAQPLKTITAAAAAANANNYHSIGSRVLINPGTYRETVTLLGNQYNTPAPITFESTDKGVVISGSVQYSNWQPTSTNPSIYVTNWNNDWGPCAANADPTSPFEQPIVLRREMIFVNGTLLTQVMSLAQMQPGTFSVNESSNKAYIWPAAGFNESTADVEVATLPEVLHIVGRSNLVFRGLSFIHAASCRDNNAVYVAGSSKNILFENDSFRWNNAIGLHFFTPVSNYTVHASSANHNGQSGMMSVQTKFGEWDSVTTSFNNWRGAQGAYYYWNSGGMHFYQAHNHTISGLVTAYNQTHGVHFDTDNANINVGKALVAQNLAIGIAVEKNEGPVAISNSNFCANNLGIKLNYLYQAGLVLRNSEHVTLTSSNFYNNEVSQISVIGVKGGVEITNWETGLTSNLRTQFFTHTGNSIEAVGNSQQVFSDSYLGDTDWTVFQTTLNSNQNTWWNGSYNTAFEVPISQVHALTGWQSVTGQDSASSWAEPTDVSTGCAVTSTPDFWFLVDNPGQTADATGTATFNLGLLPFGGLTGTANLTLDGVNEVNGLSGSLSVNSSLLTGSSVLTVNAAPGTAPGTYPITVIANSGSRTRTVTASFVVPATKVRLSTVNLTFATQKMKTTSPAHSFTVTNFGGSALAVSGLVSSSTEFAQTNNCGASLAPGKACTVNVTFTPKAKGARKGTLSITDKDGTSPQVVSLLGTGN